MLHLWKALQFEQQDMTHNVPTTATIVSVCLSVENTSVLTVSVLVTSLDNTSIPTIRSGLTSMPTTATIVSVPFICGKFYDVGDLA